MMKRIIFLVLLGAGSFPVELKAQHSIEKDYGILLFNGKAAVYSQTKRMVIDSFEVKNGIGKYIPKPEHTGDITMFALNKVDPNFSHYLITDKGTITITATRDSMIFITGTPNNDAFFELDKKLEPLRIKMRKGNRAIKELEAKGLTNEVESARAEVIKIANEWWAYQEKFAMENNNLAGLNYVRKCFSRFSPQQMKQILESHKNLADHAVYKNVKRQYEAELTTGKGVVPPGFSLPDPSGNMISLASLKNKVVILDFWASWCKPCRAENPNLLALYSKWKEKGLEIISVSIDAPKDKEKWIGAIKEDGLTWLQVWDEKGEVNKVYGITSIPRTYLLDEKGAIIAKDLRGEEMTKAVDKIMANK